MLCALPVFVEDTPRLFNLLTWIHQLGGSREHDAVIVADADTPASRVLRILDEARKSFKTVEITTTEEPVKGWPAGPNSLFLEAAQYAEKRNTPWLFLEPDAVPLCPGWLDAIAMHYAANGARYLGVIVPCSTPGLPPLHLAGVAVYPASAYAELAARILSNPKTPFDLATANILASIATPCPLFQHLWGEWGKPPTFTQNGIPGTRTFGLRYLKPDAVLFHRTKDGSLIDLLRQKKGIQKKTFIQLGRLGDIILLMPAMKYLYETDGVKPRLIVAEENASVLEGVSYVDACPLKVHWWFGMKEAREYAAQNFGGATVIQCHADQYQCDVNEHKTFMESTHSRTGVSRSLFKILPMVFDRRSREREAQNIPDTGGKPFILINTVGFSSPFPYHAQLRASLEHFKSRIAIVDMTTIKLDRIYDLLGLYDRAIGSIHIDTATLHLAHGSPTPYIGLTRGGWATATPRGNCALTMEYSQYPKRVKEVVETVESWIPKS